MWHDLGEGDFIHPAHGNDYVLKGSEILEENSPLITKSNSQFSSSFKKTSSETIVPGKDHNISSASRRRNQSWAASDFGQYKVYKSDFSGEFVSRAAADASTQTGERRRQSRAVVEIEEEKSEENCENIDRHSTDEISPPPSDSSPENLETLMKMDPRIVLCPDDQPTVQNQSNVRFKASTVLMQLLSCGSLSFNYCGPSIGKEHGSALRLPRGTGGRRDRVGKGAVEDVVEPHRVILENKEYFSGSFVETKKDKVLNLVKRSNSCNADRTSHIGLMEKETKRK